MLIRSYIGISITHSNLTQDQEAQFLYCCHVGSAPVGFCQCTQCTVFGKNGAGLSRPIPVLREMRQGSPISESQHIRFIVWAVYARCWSHLQSWGQGWPQPKWGVGLLISALNWDLWVNLEKQLKFLDHVTTTCLSFLQDRRYRQFPVRIILRWQMTQSS